MKNKQPIAPVEQYEPPAGTELGTVAELTQFSPCTQFPSLCN